MAVEYVQEGDSVEVDTQAKIDNLKFGDWVCFKNRTVVAEVLMASIDDYDESKTAIADAYQGINNKTTNILYKDKVDDVWNQDKSATSFYQLCAADRDVAVQCCMNPNDPSQDSANAVAAEHSFTPPSLDDYRARDFCENSLEENGRQVRRSRGFPPAALVRRTPLPPSPPCRAVCRRWSPPPPSPPPPPWGRRRPRRHFPRRRPVAYRPPRRFAQPAAGAPPHRWGDRPPP